MKRNDPRNKKRKVLIQKREGITSLESSSSVSLQVSTPWENNRSARDGGGTSGKSQDMFDACAERLLLRRDDDPGSETLLLSSYKWKRIHHDHIENKNMTQRGSDITLPDEGLGITLSIIRSQVKKTFKGLLEKKRGNWNCAERRGTKRNVS